MNVTIYVPPALQSVMEGKAAVELGVPPSASVGDVLETLLTLYPALRQRIASERRGNGHELQLFLPEQASLELARHRSGLREGQRMYLFASSPTRVS